MNGKQGCPPGQIMINHYDPIFGVKCYTREEIQRRFDSLKKTTIDDLFFKGDESDLRIIQHTIKEHLRLNFHPRNWREK